MLNKLLFVLFAIVLALVCLGQEFQKLSLQGEVNRLKMENSILEQSYELAKDEIREWSNKRTYEEGLTDGLVRSGTTGYRDGYHAALAQVEETKQYESKKNSELTPLTLQK